MAGKHSLKSKDLFESNYERKTDVTSPSNNDDFNNNSFSNNDFNNVNNEVMQDNNMYNNTEKDDEINGKYSDKLDEFDSSKFKDYDFEDEYYQDEAAKRKAIICVSLIIILIIAAVLVYVIFIRNNKTDTSQTNQTNEVVQDRMISTYNGYGVLGKIVIDKIGVDQYILNSTDEKALENGTTKLYGGSLNSYGNFCIAGHNNENIFEKLSELEIGDTFKIVDKYLEETTYKITEKKSVEPDDLSPLLQNEEKVEITLITCENGATTRLIVKAEEVLKDTEETEINTDNTVNTNSEIDSEENM